MALQETSRGLTSCANDRAGAVRLVVQCLAKSDRGQFPPCSVNNARFLNQVFLPATLPSSTH